MDDQPVIKAPSYGLLLAQTPCNLCQAATPTAAVWVPSFQSTEAEEVVDQGEGALLKYIEWLEPAALDFIQGHAPWLRVAATRTYGRPYLAHHCTTCGAIQGDHFLFSPDGPYWPETLDEVAGFEFIQGLGELHAKGTAGQSEWMNQVEKVCIQE